MASGPHRKRPSKRSSLSPPSHNNSPPKASGSTRLARPSLVATLLLILCVVVLLYAFTPTQHAFTVQASSQLYSVEVVNEFPHDRKAFTQGLLYGGDDTLFESTGLYGQSSVRKVALQTGKVEVLHKMGDSYFGEGLTLLGERLFQVTWLQQTGFIYHRNNFSQFEKFTHNMQDGWGLATDGRVLFGSDGTSTLYQLDPHTMKAQVKHTVKYKDQQVHNLNELEFVNGEVWANVWQTDCIARISPKDGSVLAWILLPNLRKKLIAAGETDIDVLNGIAWDSVQKRLFVTGKLWPKLFEIKLQPLEKPGDGSIEGLCLRRRPFHF